MRAGRGRVVILPITPCPSILLMVGSPGLSVGADETIQIPATAAALKLENRLSWRLISLPRLKLSLRDVTWDDGDVGMHGKA